MTAWSHAAAPDGTAPTLKVGVDATANRLIERYIRRTGTMDSATTAMLLARWHLAHETAKPSPLGVAGWRGWCFEMTGNPIEVTEGCSGAPKWVSR